MTALNVLSCLSNSSPNPSPSCRLRADRLVMRLVALALLAYCMIPTASADCSPAHIRELSNRGKSTAAIARQCGMSEQDVSAALKSEDNESSDDDPDDSGTPPERSTPGLPPGRRLSACGCWGFVAPGAGQPNPSCASGYEHAVACPGVCSAGGLPWARVCQ